MSKSIAATIALTLGALIRSLPLAAQGPRVHIGVAGALWIPTSLYRHADSAEDGFSAGFSGLTMLDVRFPRTPVGLRLDVSTGHNSANDSLKSHLSAGVGAPTDAKMTLTGVMANATYNLQPAARVRGYFLAGIGLYKVKFSVTSGSTVDTSATKFAWNVGGGITVGSGVVAWFVEARYLDVAALFGIKPTGLVTTAGVRVAVGGR